MIPLDAAGIFAAGLLVFLAPISLAWISFEMEKTWNERREIRGLSQCRLCGAMISGVRMGHIVNCPRCGALNETTKLKIF